MLPFAIREQFAFERLVHIKELALQFAKVKQSARIVLARTFHEVNVSECDLTVGSISRVKLTPSACM